MGQPGGGHTPSLTFRRGGAPRELKHLSTARKRKDSPSSGERTGKSPNLLRVGSLPALRSGGCTASGETAAAVSRGKSSGRSRRLLERAAAAGESPVGDAVRWGVPLVRKYHRTRDIWWEAGGTTLQG
jgi:hypothetical protein